VTVSRGFAVEPSVKVGGRDADQSEGKLDFGPMLDAVLECMQQKEALRIPVSLAPIGQINLFIVAEGRGDRDELIARVDGDLAQDREPWPTAPAVQLALVLPTFGPQNGGLLAADDMHEQLTNGAGDARSVRVQLRLGEFAARVDQGEVRPPVVAKAVDKSLAQISFPRWITSVFSLEAMLTIFRLIRSTTVVSVHPDTARYETA